MNIFHAAQTGTARTARCVLLAIFLSLAVLPAAAQAGPALPAPPSRAASRPARPATRPDQPAPPALNIQVVTATQPVFSASNSQTAATVACPANTLLVGGGIRTYFATGDSVVTSTTFEPINGLVMRGTYPSDALGNTTTAVNPPAWTALAGFSGQNEPGDNVTAYALCAARNLPTSPVTTTVVSTTINGPVTSATTASTTATCPAGDTLVGGGALMGPTGTPNSSASQKPVGSYPSDASGAEVSTNPNSWTAVGSSGGRTYTGNFTSAFALCASTSGPGYPTQVVRTDVNGPAGPGNDNPGSDPVATATATCPVGSTLVDGGALTSNPAGLQQGVHVRGSYPSDPSGAPLTTAPASWSAIVQSGGQSTPGTLTSAFALCAQAPALPPADLAVRVSGPASVAVGAPVVFTVTATNLGPATATGITVTDTVSAGAVIDMPHCLAGTCPAVGPTAAWAIASLAPGASMAMTVTETAGSAGPFTNTATVTGSPADPNPANNTASVTTTANAHHPPGQGYWLHGTDGGVFTFGTAKFFGSTGAMVLNQPVVGMAATPDGHGYWLVAADGGIFNYGDAGFFGSAGSLSLNKPIVGMAATPDGQGYWLVASDGGIFNYGDAGFFGSAGSLSLNKPIVGMAATPDGHGYWLVASDGGIFNYGDAAFFGSAGSIALNKPIVGMAATPDGHGYWLVASDGGIFNYGDAGFFGSAGGITLNKPIVGMAATPDGQGYWLAATDGGVFTYGDAAFLGSLGSMPLNKPIGGITSTG